MLIYEFTESQGGLYYAYDALGRTSQVVPYVYMGSGDFYYLDTVSESASYTYDDVNRLSSIITESTTYHFTYDEFGNTEQILVGNIPLVTYEYAENNGKLQKMHYGNDNFVEYSYNELDRISDVCYTYTDSNGNSVEDHYLYTYTSSGEIHSVKSTEANREYFYIRNSEGKAIFYNETNATDGTELLQISYDYDEKNRLTDQNQRIFYTVSGNVASASYELKAEYNADELLQTYSIKLGTSNVASLSYTYDGLDRIKTKTVTGGAFSRTEGYNYKPRGGMTTYQIGTYTSSIGGYDTTYAYEYDSRGNIVTITEGNHVTKYLYDNLDQLIREDNPYLGKTYTYTYDNAGNRTSKKTHAYTTAQTPGTVTSTQTYTYSTGAWGDQLSGYTYDEIGNPSYHSSYALTWSGRQLMEMSMNGGQITYSFTYNADGIRTSKNINGTVHIYTLNGTQVVSETWGQRMLVYLYDESGAPIGMQYRSTSYAENAFDTYYFEKNIFGDIVAVYTAAGVKIGSYTYDAWGNITTTVSAGNTSIQNSVVRNYNPFRYRGYFYDYETGLYYLQSRYYNPATGRFLNADGYINANGDLIGFNMYAYCSNNPVMGYDPTGNSVVSNTMRTLDSHGNPKTLFVFYYVPLYEQGSTNLCWAYCQLMVESWKENKTYSKEEAKSLAKAMSRATYDPSKHKNPNNHFGMAKYSNSVDNVDSIHLLYKLLVEHGPVYASYENQFGFGHLIVVTGVDVNNDIVYTNNSHGSRGQQSFEEFLDGVCRPWYKSLINDYDFDKIIYIPS